jgi:hypothetical protein
VGFVAADQVHAFAFVHNSAPRYVKARSAQCMNRASRSPCRQTELMAVLRLPIGTGWQTCAEQSAHFAQTCGSGSDLVLDVTERNRGTLSTLLRYLF